ncbi:MAG: MarR family transcriptional regulator [Candidatus Gastranaerophilales bacterium]|nr:MarR family transcriptional regulator [Candidatus Gastranaerophilales bacterium]
MKTNSENHKKDYDFTQSIFYQIKLTEKYFKMMGKYLEMSFDLPITLDEMCVLLTIHQHDGEIHQRDLAKIILKDRGNTGRLLDTLENDGFIERKETTKNKRQAKVINITDSGMDAVNECFEMIEPVFKSLDKRFEQEKIDKVIEGLIHFRKIIEETIEIRI